MIRKTPNEELPRLTKEQFQQSAKTPVILVLDNVRSHLNVGSIFRTADAYLIEVIYLCGITGQPPHRDIHKTALGATDTVSWKYFGNTRDAVEELKTSGYTIISIEQADKAVMLNEFEPSGGAKYAIVFGNEVDGVSQEVVNASDVIIEIPQYGMKHSLNIAVSAGIVVWDVFCKMNK